MGGPDDELFDLFVKELEEHLEVLESSLLNLEKNIDTPDPEIINQILRASHSIKGASGFFGYSNIGQISHAMESAFEDVRDGKLAPKNDFVELMLSSVDKLKLVLENIEKNKDKDFAEEIDKINVYLEKNETAALVKIDKEPELKEAEGTDFYEFNISDETKRKTLQYGKKIYSIRFYTKKDVFKKNTTPVSLIDEMLSLGEILDADPDIEKIGSLKKRTKINVIDILLSTVLEKDLLLKELAIDAEQIRQIDTGELVEPEAALTDEVTKTAGFINTEAVKKGTSFIRSKKSLRVRTSLLDDLMKLAGELVLLRNQLLERYQRGKDKNEHLNEVIQNINRTTTELQSKIMQTRMQSLDIIFKKFPRMVRDISKELGKSILLEISGEDVELDSSIIENIYDPLVHIIRNSCDHGIEPSQERRSKGKPIQGTVKIKAYYEGEQVAIDVIDDGRGMDIEGIKQKGIEKGLVKKDEIARLSRSEILLFIFSPGFSTAKRVSSISGRGVGMDIVSENVNKLGGNVTVETKPDEGSTIRLRVPLTLAIIPSLIVSAEGGKYAIHRSDIMELINHKTYDESRKIEKVRGIPVLRMRGQLLPLLHLADVLGIERTFTHPETGEKIVDRRRKIADRRAQDLFFEELVEEEEKKKEEEKDQSKDDLINKRAAEKRRREESVLIVVVKYKDKQFGLIVDAKENVEEVVVNPLPRFFSRLKCYSGTSIRGDGSVILILDINGIASEGGLKFGDTERVALKQLERTKDLSEIGENQELLLCRARKDEYIGILLDNIRKVFEVTRNDIQGIGDREYIQLNGESICVIHLAEYLPFSKDDSEFAKKIVIIPRVDARVGFIVSDIVDSMEIFTELDRESFREEAILGSSLINGKIVIFPDIYHIIDSIAPAKKKLSLGKKKEQKCELLLAEDTQFYREIELIYLQKRGFSITCACNGYEALERMKEKDYNLVICDLKMPGLDGYQLISEIRLNPEWQDIPVLGLTRLSEKDEIERAKQAGFSDCEVKLHRDKLLEKVYNLLK